MTELDQRPAPPLSALSIHERPSSDPYEVYIASLNSPESQRTMRGALDRIVQLQTGNPDATGAWQPWWLLRYEHFIKIRATLISRGYSPTHVNKHLIGIRRVLHVCWLMGLMPADDYHRAREIKNVTGTRLPAGRSIPRNELAAMLRVCAKDDGPAAIRDQALISVLYCTGIRRSEAANALIENYDRAERQLRVIGKGDKQRAVPIMLSAVAPLDAWLTIVAVRRGPIFRRIGKDGDVSAQPVSARGIGYLVDRARKRAGLPPLATHDFRRTFIGDFLDSGGDLAQAQRIAGHASSTTTAQYDRRPDRALLAAVDQMSLPLPHDDRSEP